jgi:hypothetical protein
MTALSPDAESRRRPSALRRFGRAPRRAPAHEVTRPAPSARSAALAAALDREATAARAELARGDSKAGTLIGFAGTEFTLLTAIGAAVSSHLTPIGQIGLWSAVAALATSVVLVLGVILPSIPRTGGTGFVAHAAVDVDQLLATLADDIGEPRRRAADVIVLSRLALAKYRRLQKAVHLMYLALAVLVLTLPLGALA